MHRKMTENAQINIRLPKLLFRQVDVLLDDAVVASQWCGKLESKVVNLKAPPGKHQLVCRIGKLQTEILEIDASGGEVYKLICRTVSQIQMTSNFKIFGIGSMLALLVAGLYWRFILNISETWIHLIILYLANFFQFGSMALAFWAWSRKWGKQALALTVESGPEGAYNLSNHPDKDKQLSTAVLLTIALAAPTLMVIFMYYTVPTLFR